MLEVRTIIYPWLSLPIITVIILALVWLHMNPYMVDTAEHQYAGKKWEKENSRRKRLQTAQSRQKSYADNRRIPLEFNVGDHVFLKLSPLKGSVHFGQKGKLTDLTPRFIGPFEILQRVDLLLIV